MRWTGFVLMAGMGSLYLLLAMQVDGLLAGFGYVFAALLFLLSIMNLFKASK